MKFSRSLVLVVLVPTFALSALAFPNYLEELQRDPMLRPSFMTACGTCHVNPQGGGDRNNFGKRYEEQGAKVTPLLRATDAVKFIYPQVKVSDALTIHFSDPKNKQIVVESGDKKVLVDVEAKEVDGKKVAAPTGADAAR